jgi:hypothetical protein
MTLLSKLLLAVVLCAGCSTSLPAPDTATTAAVSAPSVVRDPSGGPLQRTVEDREGFIPRRVWPKVAGRMVGLSVYTHEPGKYENGNLTFDSGLSTPRVAVTWIGSQSFYTRREPSAAAALAAAGFQGDYNLIEAQVSQEAEYAPAQLRDVRVVQGSASYPLHPSEVVADLRSRYDRYLGEQHAAIEAEMCRRRADPAQWGALDTETYATWLPDRNVLVVRFRTEVTTKAMMHGCGIPDCNGGGAGYGPFSKIVLGRGYEVSARSELLAVDTLAMAGNDFSISPPPAAPPSRP